MSAAVDVGRPVIVTVSDTDSQSVSLSLRRCSGQCNAVNHSMPTLHTAITGTVTVRLGLVHFQGITITIEDHRHR